MPIPIINQKTNASINNGCCGHIPLLNPMKWCCRQIRYIDSFHGVAGSSLCAKVASKTGYFVLAILLFIPSAILAGIGLCFSCAFSKGPTGTGIPKSINPSTARKPKSASVASPSKPKPKQPAPTPTLAPPLHLPPDMIDFIPEDLVFDDPNYTSDEVLDNKAMLFFLNPNVKNRTSLNLDFSRLGANATDYKIIDTIFDKHIGFNLGEFHDDATAKRFLIENMAYLKGKGVTTLFYEGPEIKYQQAMDYYLQGVCGLEDPTVRELMKYIDSLDTNWKMPADGSYRGVVEEAKKNGIRIVFYDYDFRANQKMGGRFLRMNYIAAKAMARELQKFGPNDRFIGLMGAYHVTQIKNDPNLGLSELFQCPAVCIRDNKTDPTKRHVLYGNLPQDPHLGQVHINILKGSMA